MTDAAYNAWRADRDAGLISVLIAETHEDVTTLNERARADLILNKTLNPDREVELRDGTAAGVGDTIITRLNNREPAHPGRPGLGAQRRHLDHHRRRRGQDHHHRTRLRDRHHGPRRRNHQSSPTGAQVRRSIVLPASYVAEHVDLGYAVTAYRAQGVTTDTAHVLVEPTSTRETFYVAMTRGRHANHAYVTLDRTDDHAQPHPGDDPHATARSVLYGVLQHSGAELSAHETIVAEQEQWGSIAQLAAEYETIAAAAQHDRWASLVRGAGLTDEQAESAIESEAFGPLTAELRRPKPTTMTSMCCCRASSPRAASTTPTTSPPYSTTESSARPPGPQAQAGLASQRDSSPASSHRRTESSTPRCEQRSTNENH
jgi:hypothetical protein